MLDSLRTYSIHTAPDKPLGCIFCKENFVSCCSRAIQQSPLQHTKQAEWPWMLPIIQILQCFVCIDSVTKMMGYSWELLRLLHPVGRVVTLIKCKVQQSLRPQTRGSATWCPNTLKGEKQVDMIMNKPLEKSYDRIAIAELDSDSSVSRARECCLQIINPKTISKIHCRFTSECFKLDYEAHRWVVD